LITLFTIVPGLLIGREIRIVRDQLKLPYFFTPPRRWKKVWVKKRFKTLPKGKP
jgi:hypothetical protein